MITKIYQIGLNEAVYPFALGNYRCRITFTGGSMQSKTPAIYVTSDPLEQLAIEKSKPFAEKTITIQSVIENTVKEPVIAEKAEEVIEKAPAPVEEVIKGSELLEVPEVTDLNSAAAFLKEKKVHFSKFKSAATMVKAANELGFTFPNLVITE